MISQSQLVALAIDAAFTVIQEAHDSENLFNAGQAADLYADSFPEFQKLFDSLSHYADWEAARVAARRNNEAGESRRLATEARERAAALANEASEAAAIAEQLEFTAEAAEARLSRPPLPPEDNGTAGGLV